ncbi:MAG: hypothetical protein ACJ74J_10985 [Blastocatellia bacterium]
MSSASAASRRRISGWVDDLNDRQVDDHRWPDVIHSSMISSRCNERARPSRVDKHPRI